MALPRYNPSEVRLIDGAATSIAQQAKSSAFQNLSSKMDAWNNTISSELASIRQQEGQEQAKIDVSKGTFKPKESMLSIYDKAYDNVGKATYIAKTEEDAKTYSELLKNKLNTNPETMNDPDIYSQTFDKYMQTVLSEAPDEYTKEVLKSSLINYGSQQYNSILSIKAKQVEEQNKQGFEDGKKLYVNEYKEAVRSKDPQKIEQAQNKLISFIDVGIGKYTNVYEVQNELNQLKKDVFVETSIEEFKNSNNRVEYLSKFRDNTFLSPDETDKAIDGFHKMMQSEVKDTQIQLDTQNAQYEVMKKATSIALNNKLLDNNLTKDDLDRALRVNAITKTEYDDYFNRSMTEGVTVSDERTYGFYLKNMDTTSTDEIMRDGTLSNQKKKELIARKEELQLQTEKEAKEMGNWEGTSRGKQAISEIKLHFKIFDGTIMSKADINNDSMRDYATIRRELYDTIEQLPLEEKTNKSLEIARQMLKDYKDGKIIDTMPYRERLDKEEQAEEKRMEDAKKAEDEKNKPVKGGNAFSKFLPSF